MQSGLVVEEVSDFGPGVDTSVLSDDALVAALLSTADTNGLIAKISMDQRRAGTARRMDSSAHAAANVTGSWAGSAPFSHSQQLSSARAKSRGRSGSRLMAPDTSPQPAAAPPLRTRTNSYPTVLPTSDALFAPQAEVMRPPTSAPSSADVAAPLHPFSAPIAAVQHSSRSVSPDPADFGPPPSAPIRSNRPSVASHRSRSGSARPQPLLAPTTADSPPPVLVPQPALATGPAGEHHEDGLHLERRRPDSQSVVAPPMASATLGAAVVHLSTADRPQSPPSLLHTAPCSVQPRPATGVPAAAVPFDIPDHTTQDTESHGSAGPRPTISSVMARGAPRWSPQGAKTKGPPSRSPGKRKAAARPMAPALTPQRQGDTTPPPPSHRALAARLEQSPSIFDTSNQRSVRRLSQAARRKNAYHTLASASANGGPREAIQSLRSGPGPAGYIDLSPTPRMDPSPDDSGALFDAHSGAQRTDPVFLHTPFGYTRNPLGQRSKSEFLATHNTHEAQPLFPYEPSPHRSLSGSAAPNALSPLTHALSHPTVEPHVQGDPAARSRSGPTQPPADDARRDASPPQRDVLSPQSRSLSQNQGRGASPAAKKIAARKGPTSTPPSAHKKAPQKGTPKAKPRVSTQSTKGTQCILIDPSSEPATPEAPAVLEAQSPPAGPLAITAPVAPSPPRDEVVIDLTGPVTPPRELPKKTPRGSPNRPPTAPSVEMALVPHAASAPTQSGGPGAAGHSPGRSPSRPALVSPASDSDTEAQGAHHQRRGDREHRSVVLSPPKDERPSPDRPTTPPSPMLHETVIHEGGSPHGSTASDGRDGDGRTSSYSYYYYSSSASEASDGTISDFFDADLPPRPQERRSTLPPQPQQPPVQQPRRRSAPQPQPRRPVGGKSAQRPPHDQRAAVRQPGSRAAQPAHPQQNPNARCQQQRPGEPIGLPRQQQQGTPQPSPSPSSSFAVPLRTHHQPPHAFVRSASAPLHADPSQRMGQPPQGQHGQRFGKPGQAPPHPQQQQHQRQRQQQLQRPSQHSQQRPQNAQGQPAVRPVQQRPMSAGPAQQARPVVQGRPPAGPPIQERIYQPGSRSPVAVRTASQPPRPAAYRSIDAALVGPATTTRAVTAAPAPATHRPRFASPSHPTTPHSRVQLHPGRTYASPGGAIVRVALPTDVTSGDTFHPPPSSAPLDIPPPPVPLQQVDADPPAPRAVGIAAAPGSGYIDFDAPLPPRSSLHGAHSHGASPLRTLSPHRGIAGSRSFTPGPGAHAAPSAPRAASASTPAYMTPYTAHGTPQSSAVSRAGSRSTQRPPTVPSSRVDSRSATPAQAGATMPPTPRVRVRSPSASRSATPRGGSVPPASLHSTQRPSAAGAYDDIPPPPTDRPPLAAPSLKALMERPPSTRVRAGNTSTSWSR